MEHDTDKGENGVDNLLYIKLEDYILSGESMSEYQNIEHQRTWDDKSVSEHQNKTSTGIPHIDNLGNGLNRLEMIFNVKVYDNVQFTIIGENKDFERSNDCLRIATNFVFTQMSANIGILLFKDCRVAVIVKEYTQLGYMNVVGPENPNVLPPKKN